MKNRIYTIACQLNSLALLVMPTIAFAGGGETPVGSTLGYIKDALLGGTGMTIATLAMMSVGLLCLFHKLEWKYFGITIAGIGIVFGAPLMVDAIVTLAKKGM